MEHELGSVQSREDYQRLYDRSLQDPEGFWGGIADGFYWKQKWTGPVCEYNFSRKKGRVFAKWFQGGLTNICYNAVDRHVEGGAGDRVAIYWEGNDPSDPPRTLTYRELLDLVCQIANQLKAMGVQQGDCVTTYMPMVPELPATMLACARIGAVHSVVFGGFSADSLAQRLEDARSRVLVTCSGVMRGPKRIELKRIADDAMAQLEARGHAVTHCLVYDHPSPAVPQCSMAEGRDLRWSEYVPRMPTACPVAWLDAEAPSFMLYTSGSTGKPKGVLHTTAGYMIGAATTFKYVFGYRPGDVYWCGADCGWITGHSYVVYGPLLCGATQVVFEGIPTWPDAGRSWEIVDKYHVNIFYTAPTAIRTLMAAGDSFVTRHSRKSLRALGSVGEPINPEAWRWYHDVVGGGRCPVMDTWWQTETGAHMITPLPGAWEQKPGCATLPFYGVDAALLDERGQEVRGAGEGFLVLRRAWPSMMRTVQGDHDRFEATYFSQYDGYYFTGDGARRDEDGFYWLTGRVDDVINVSGHRLGTAEVESALVEHPLVAEAAVVPLEHHIKGQGIYAYVTLVAGQAYPGSEELRKELVALVRKKIGPIATPDVIHWAPGLPKTRSGKIMRRILRKLAHHEEDHLGDISTLADPSVVATLLELRGK